MTTLLILIIVLFPVGIFLRKIFPQLCALCFSVTFSWILGLLYLILFERTNNRVDDLSLSILMGGSAVGSMYYVFGRLKEEKQIFKLPYLITLFYFSFLILSQEVDTFVFTGVIILWLVFIFLYSLRNSLWKGKIQKIIECCKNW